MKNKLIKCGSLLLFLLILVCTILPFSYLNENRMESKNKGSIETFGVNDEGYLEIGGEILYMSVNGKRVPATLEGLFKEGDKNQELLTKADLDSKKNSNAFISTLVSFVKPQIAKASSVKIEYKGIVSYGGNIVGDFRVNGKQAFCFQHSKPTPPTGASYEKEIPYNNARVQRALYYGWGGEGNIFKNKAEGIVTTSLILDRIYSGGSTGKSLPNYDKLWDLVVNGKDLDRGISFNNRNLSVTVKGEKQVSQTTKLETASNNYVKVSVPSGITIVNESTGKKITNGTMKIYGGEKIHLEAGLDKGYSYSTGTLKSGLKSFQPLITKPSGGGYQVLGFGEWYTDPNNTTSFKAEFKVRQRKITVQHIDRYTNKVLKTEEYKRTIGSTYSFQPKDSINQGDNKFVPENHKSKSGTVGNKDVTIKFYYNLQRKITVLHKDNRDQTLLKKEVYTKNRGDSYSYSPLKNLKKGEYTYRPVSTKNKTGTVGKNNITITFYYDVPLMKVKLDKLQIYTDNSTTGLPVKVSLSKKLIYNLDTKGFDTAKINVSLYQGKNKLETKAYTAKSLPDKLDMKVPSKGLKVNQKKPYTVKFEGFNKNDIDVPSDTANLTTDGYTSSEETVKLNVKQTLEGYKISHVVMTEITPTTPMKIYNEFFTFTGTEIPVQKTGYGTEQHIDFSYKNEIGVDDTESKLVFHTPSNLIDSFLDYPIKNNEALITMDKTKDKKEVDKSVLTRQTTFSYPHVNVEKETGYLFNDKQVKDKDKHITKSIIDGGRKFYTPIWTDLGKYKVSYQSNDLGVNDVKFILNDTLELNAFMYSHMDSNTKSKDEILLTPINADDPFPNGIPKGWTSQDMKWLQQ